MSNIDPSYNDINADKSESEIADSLKDQKVLSEDFQGQESLGQEFQEQEYEDALDANGIPFRRLVERTQGEDYYGSGFKPSKATGFRNLQRLTTAIMCGVLIAVTVKVSGGGGAAGGSLSSIFSNLGVFKKLFDKLFDSISALLNYLFIKLPLSIIRAIGSGVYSCRTFLIDLWNGRYRITDKIFYLLKNFFTLVVGPILTFILVLLVIIAVLFIGLGQAHLLSWFTASVAQYTTVELGKSFIQFATTEKTPPTPASPLPLTLAKDFYRHFGANVLTKAVKRVPSAIVDIGFRTFLKLDLLLLTIGLNFFIYLYIVWLSQPMRQSYKENLLKYVPSAEAQPSTRAPRKTSKSYKRAITDHLKQSLAYISSTIASITIRRIIFRILWFIAKVVFINFFMDLMKLYLLKVIPFFMDFFKNCGNEKHLSGLLEHFIKNSGKAGSNRPYLFLLVESSKSVFSSKFWVALWDKPFEQYKSKSPGSPVQHLMPSVVYKILFTLKALVLYCNPSSKDMKASARLFLRTSLTVDLLCVHWWEFMIIGSKVILNHAIFYVSRKLKIYPEDSRRVFFESSVFNDIYVAFIEKEGTLRDLIVFIKELPQNIRKHGIKYIFFQVKVLIKRTLYLILDIVKSMFTVFFTLAVRYATFIFVIAWFIAKIAHECLFTVKEIFKTVPYLIYTVISGFFSYALQIIAALWRSITIGKQIGKAMCGAIIYLVSTVYHICLSLVYICAIIIKTGFLLFLVFLAQVVWTVLGSPFWFIGKLTEWISRLPSLFIWYSRAILTGILKQLWEFINSYVENIPWLFQKGKSWINSFNFQWFQLNWFTRAVKFIFNCVAYSILAAVIVIYIVGGIGLVYIFGESITQANRWTSLADLLGSFLTWIIENPVTMFVEALAWVVRVCVSGLLSEKVQKAVVSLMVRVAGMFADFAWKIFTLIGGNFLPILWHAIVGFFTINFSAFLDYIPSPDAILDFALNFAVSVGLKLKNVVEFTIVDIPNTIFKQYTLNPKPGDVLKLLSTAGLVVGSQAMFLILGDPQVVNPIVSALRYARGSSEITHSPIYWSYYFWVLPFARVIHLISYITVGLLSTLRVVPKQDLETMDRFFESKWRVQKAFDNLNLEKKYGKRSNQNPPESETEDYLEVLKVEESHQKDLLEKLNLSFKNPSKRSLFRSYENLYSTTVIFKEHYENLEIFNEEHKEYIGKANEVARKREERLREMSLVLNEKNKASLVDVYSFLRKWWVCEFEPIKDFSTNMWACTEAWFSIKSLWKPQGILVYHFYAKNAQTLRKEGLEKAKAKEKAHLMGLRQEYQTLYGGSELPDISFEAYTNLVNSLRDIEVAKYVREKWAEYSSNLGSSMPGGQDLLEKIKKKHYVLSLTMEYWLSLKQRCIKHSGQTESTITSDSAYKSASTGSPKAAAAAPAAPAAPPPAQPAQGAQEGAGLELAVIARQGGLQPAPLPVQPAQPAQPAQEAQVGAGPAIIAQQGGLLPAPLPVQPAQPAQGAQPVQGAQEGAGPAVMAQQEGLPPLPPPALPPPPPPEVQT